MAQGIIISKSETKRIHQTQENFDRKIKDCREFVVKVYYALTNMDDDAAVTLLTNVDTIETFVKETFYGRGGNIYRCPYILHGILTILSTQRYDFLSVLDKMSKSDVATLKSLVEAAQKMEKPNVEIIEQNIDKIKGSIATIDKVPQEKQLALKGWSISLEAGNLWDNAVSALNKLMESINIFERRPHISTVIKDNIEDENCETWSIKELAEKLGVKSLDAVYSQKNRIVSAHGYVENWFVKKGTRVYFIAKYFDEYKRLSVNENCEEYNSSEHLTLDELSQLLGFNNIKLFYDQKKRIVAKNHKVQKWFVKEKGSTRTLFIMKHFNEYERLSKGEYDKNKYMTLEELADCLNCNVVSFYRRKSKILKKYPEAKDVIESWFVHRGKEEALFDITHLKEFTVLFLDGRRSVTVKDKSNSDKKIKPVKSAKQNKKTQIKKRKVATNETNKEEVEECKGPYIVEEVKAKPETVMPTEQVPVKDDDDLSMIFDPKNIDNYVSVKSIKFRLEQLQKDLEQMQKENTEQKYAEIMTQLNKEQDAEKRADLLSQITDTNDLMIKTKRLRTAIENCQKGFELRKQSMAMLEQSRALLYEFWENTTNYIK